MGRKTGGERVDITVCVKSIARRKPVLDRQPYALPDGIGTLRELLTALVAQEVQRYNEKRPDAQLLPFLMEEQLADALPTGKVGFGRRRNERDADLARAQENALQCFIDGIYRVFLGDTEVCELDAPLPWKGADELTLIRLAMLSGRMW